MHMRNIVVNLLVQWPLSLLGLCFPSFFLSVSVLCGDLMQELGVFSLNNIPKFYLIKLNLVIYVVNSNNIRIQHSNGPQMYKVRTYKGICQVVSSFLQEGCGYNCALMWPDMLKLAVSMIQFFTNFCFEHMS